MITTHVKGHKICWNIHSEIWVYVDTGEPYHDQRPCKRCGKTGEYDSCLGKLDGVVSACCGHGVEDGWVILSDGNKLTLEEYFKDVEL